MNILLCLENCGDFGIGGRSARMEIVDFKLRKKGGGVLSKGCKA